MTNLALSLVIGFFIGVVAGYLGSLMLSRKMSLAAGPLGHLTLPGVALALLNGFDVSLGAFPFVILGAFLIWLLEMRTKLPMEALTAVVFTFGVSVALLFLPLDKAEAALMGDISKVGLYDTLIALPLLAIIFFVTKAIYPKVFLINISEDLAKVEGIDVKKYNLIYLFLIAAIVALGTKLVGGLMTAAIVAIPSASARNLSRNLSNYRFLAALFGGTSMIAGIALSVFSNLPVGPLIILSNVAVFFLSVIMKR
ncbi:metal ABC transporter permease [Candidatus Bathyarchaeota archaeon]|nr:metal ABC transporter permease [Candidatus Bathyarchaeota archaeon]